MWNLLWCFHIWICKGGRFYNVCWILIWKSRNGIAKLTIIIYETTINNFQKLPKYNEREIRFLLPPNVFIIYSNKSLWLVFQMSNTLFWVYKLQSIYTGKVYQHLCNLKHIPRKNITIPILRSIINKVLQFCYSKRALISAALRWINVFTLKLAPEMS